MAVLFVLVGAFLGGLSGSLWGAVIGAVAGFLFFKLRKTGGPQAPQPSTKGASLDDPLALVRRLERRIAGLEDVVGTLRAQVERLSQAGAAPQTVTEPDVVVQPLALVRDEVAADRPASVPLQAEVPMVFKTSVASAQAVSESELVEQALAATPLEQPPQEIPAEANHPPAEPPQAEAQPRPHQVVPPTVTAAPAVPRVEPLRPARPAPVRQAPPPRELRDYVPARLQPLIFGGNTIVKVGVLILFLGLSFLLKYVAEQVTVPIELRYAGVALLGAGLLGLGWRLRHRRDASGAAGYGLILQGAGVGVFYLTTLAAMKLHPLLPVTVGFGVMVLITAFTAILAVAQNAPWLAIVASTAGFATPVLVSTGQANHIALFSYLAILNAGILTMAWFRAWRPLNLIGFIGTFTLASGWASAHYRPEVYASAQGFLLLFFLMFTAIGVLFARRALALGEEAEADASIGERASHALRQLGRVDSTLVFGVPLAVYGLQYQMVRDDPWLPALSALVLGLFYVLLGGALWRGKEARYALLAEAYVVVGVLFGTLSIPLALEGVWTGATWAVEAAGMYWLGTRQHRTYTRAFAMALMAGAAARTLSSLGWDGSPGTPVLTGSTLGMALLALSALSMALVFRRAQRPAGALAHPDWEAGMVSSTWWLAVGAIAVLPWMWLVPMWASVATAGVALSSMWLGERSAVPQLKSFAPVLHIVSVLGFASNLHQQEGEAMLANGVPGLTGAVLIGMSMLGSAWLGLRETWRRASAADARDTAPAWTLGSNLGVVAGLGVISGALLFMMPMEHAALIWPFIGLGMLWVGLKLAHPALSFVWAALTAASALAFMLLGPQVWQVLAPSPVPLPWRGPLGGLAWWTPLVLVVCTVIAAAWLNKAARRTQGWRMPWVSNGRVQLFMLLASLWWWAQVLPPEVMIWLQLKGLTAWVSASLCLWVTFTSVLMLMLARRLNWPLMGQAAGLTIPMWVAALAIGPLGDGQAPLSQLGWLAWPLALLWHPVALRLNARWWRRAPQSWMHVAGFWLFALIVARQVQWHADRWTTAGTAWQALAWLVVPLTLVAAVSWPRWQARWPLSEFASAYRVIGAAPLLLTMVLWLASSVFNAGQASPLPYVPLVNPLELGEGLAMLTLLWWARSLPQDSGVKLPNRSTRIGILGGTAFVLLTTMVLRTCHHWAGVPWDEGALFASRLTQAALSVTWSLLGVGLMILGHRRGKRLVWGVGAALLGVVVVKLFFIELADHGSLYRIVSFIVVGLLLLVVGYFAPVPPANGEAPKAGLKEST